MNCEYCGYEHTPDPFYCIARLQEQNESLFTEQLRLAEVNERQAEEIDRLRRYANMKAVSELGEIKFNAAETALKQQEVKG